MFFATTEIEIRDRAGLSGAVIGKILANSEVDVEGITGQAVVQDGWIWHKLKGRDGWAAERNVDGSIITLSWRGTQPPPVIPITTLDSRAGVPAQPSNFTHQNLLDAVNLAATAAGASATEWLNRGRLYWLSNDPSATYWGDPIANLPYLKRQQKTDIINQLAAILEGKVQPAAQPQPTPVAATTPAAAPAPAVVTAPSAQPVLNIPSNVDLDPADYTRVKRAAFNITRAFEGGGYASYNNYDRGIVSYGFVQFTLGSGSLGRVLEKYLEAASSATASSLRQEYQQRVSDKDTALREDTRFRDLLKAAAEEQVMQDAQQEIATINYWDVVLENYVQRRGNIRLPLSYALLFDMGIHLGVNHAYVRRAEEALGVPSNSRPGDNGVTEQQLFSKVAELRRDAHSRQADRDNLPGLKVRGEFWVNLTQQGDWQLQGDANGFVYPKSGRQVQVRTPTY